MDVMVAGDIHGHDIADPIWTGSGYSLVKWMGIWDKRIILGGGLSNNVHIHGILCTFNLYTWNVFGIYSHSMNNQSPKQFQNFNKLLVWNIEQKLIFNYTCILVSGTDTLRIWLKLTLLHFLGWTNDKTTIYGISTTWPISKTPFASGDGMNNSYTYIKMKKIQLSCSCVHWCFCCCVDFIS